MTSIIKRSELTAAVADSSLQVGTYVTDSDGLYQLVEEVPDVGFVIRQLNPDTLEAMNERKITYATLREYYHPLSLSMEEVKRLAERVLNGEPMEEATEVSDTALMATSSKENLLTLREEASRAALVASKVKEYARIIIRQRTAELEARLSGLNGVIEKMNKEIQRIDYIIQIVETYAGIKERVETLCTGTPAPQETPIVFRQAVIFLDEEMALIDDDFDWLKMDRFDKWLLTDDNFKKLLPDEKSMIACKPRRTEKTYVANDPIYNRIMNNPNFETLFLIRNGDCLYRIESEHIALYDRMFPNLDEYAKVREDEEKHWRKNTDSEYFRKRYIRVAYLMQGLLDRSDVFSPHSVTGSLINLEGFTDEQVQLRYELDTSRALSDGRPSPTEWINQQNKKLCEGKRVLLYNYKFDADMDFLRYYRSKYTAPELPDWGIYTLYNNPHHTAESAYCVYPYIIRYLPKSDYYKKRVQKEPIQVSADHHGGILNYDDASLDDVEYYLNSRLHRSQYYSFVRLMKAFKRCYLADLKVEQDYIRMLAGQIASRRLQPKAGFTAEQVARHAIDKVKSRLKWKRPITAKEKETYTLVERTLFSKEFLKKYFE